MEVPARRRRLEGVFPGTAAPFDEIDQRHMCLLRRSAASRLPPAVWYVHVPVAESMGCRENFSGIQSRLFALQPRRPFDSAAHPVAEQSRRRSVGILEVPG